MQLIINVHAHMPQQGGISDRHVVTAVNVIVDIVVFVVGHRTFPSLRATSLSRRHVQSCFALFSILYTNNIPLSSLHPSNTKGPLLKSLSAQAPTFLLESTSPKRRRTRRRRRNFSRIVFFFFLLSLVSSFKLPHVQKNIICTKHTVLIFCFSKEKVPLSSRMGVSRRTMATSPPYLPAQPLACLVTLGLRYTVTDIITHPA